MSIAFSAVISPSRYLRNLFFAMLFLANIAVIYVMLLHLSIEVSLVGFWLILLVGLNGITIFSYLKKERSYLINMTDSGACILRELKKDRTVIASHEVRLLSETVVWEYLIVLHLQVVNGKKLKIPVLCDSLSSEGFRALTIAALWARYQSVDRPQQIDENSKYDANDGNF